MYGSLPRLQFQPAAVAGGAPDNLDGDWVFHRGGGDGAAVLQLQLLGGCGEAGGVCEDAAGASSSSDSGGGGGAGASRNTSLQDVSIECSGALTDDELAAAAGALPDLRKLEVISSPDQPANYNYERGLCGHGLAALSACWRLQVLRLNGCINLDGRELAAQLPSIDGLLTLQLAMRHTMNKVTDDNVQILQAVFQTKHGRHLRVVDDDFFGEKRWQFG